MGPPCVGKTSFKSLLFKWPAPKVHDSTALATRPVRAIERVAERDEGKIWLKVTGLDLLKMLSDAIIAIENESENNDPQISEISSDTILSVDPMLYLDENILLESPEQNLLSKNAIYLLMHHLFQLRWFLHKIINQYS